MLGLDRVGVGFPGSGLVLEFGVFGGRSIGEIADAIFPRVVYGFDSWRGLPEDWSSGDRVIAKGYFACGLPRVRDNVVLVEGLFQDTLGGFLREHSEGVAFVHIDCDLYSSTIFVLKALRDRFVPGSILMFDEIEEPDGLGFDHERRAWMEYLGENSGQEWGFVGRQHIAGEVWRLDNIA